MYAPVGRVVTGSDYLEQPTSIKIVMIGIASSLYIACFFCEIRNIRYIRPEASNGLLQVCIPSCVSLTDAIADLTCRVPSRLGS